MVYIEKCGGIDFGGSMKERKKKKLEDLIYEIQEKLADIRDYWVYERDTKITLKDIEDLVIEAEDLVDKLADELYG
jgi:hypothetical protein